MSKWTRWKGLVLLLLIIEQKGLEQHYGDAICLTHKLGALTWSPI